MLGTPLESAVLRGNVAWFDPCLDVDQGRITGQYAHSAGPSKFSMRRHIVRDGQAFGVETKREGKKRLYVWPPGEARKGWYVYSSSKATSTQIWRTALDGRLSGGLRATDIPG